MQEQLNQFHMFTRKLIILPTIYLKSGTKWFGINNRDGPFSTLLHIGHITGGSVIWPMCNMTHYTPHRCKKRGHVVMWVVFLAHLKLIKPHSFWQGFPTWEWWESPSPVNPTIFILTSYSLYTQVVLILILINVQYWQNVAFNFEISSSGQIHSASGSHHHTN